MAKSVHQVHSQINREGDIEHTSLQRKRVRKKDWNIPPEYLNLGLYLAVPLILAIIVGPWLDKQYETEGFFTIILLLFGTISVFYNLYRLYKQG